VTPAPTHPCSAVDSHSTFGLNARASVSWMTLSRTKPPKLAPARPLSGWGFSFPATGITLAAGTVGTAGSTRHCTGALARASEPAAPGLPFHAAVTSRHDNVDGGLLGRSASKRRRRILPLTARRRRRFSCCPKVLKRGRAVLRALKLPLTAARLPSQPGRWDGVRPLCQAPVVCPISPQCHGPAAGVAFTAHPRCAGASSCSRRGGRHTIPPGHAAIAPHQDAPHVSKPRRIEQALRGFAFCPPSPLRLVLTMEGVECLMK
jgi:hypothetical protein